MLQEKKSAKSSAAPKLVKKTAVKKSAILNFIKTFNYAKCVDLSTIHGKIFLLIVTIVLSTIVQNILTNYQSTITETNESSGKVLAQTKPQVNPSYRVYTKRSRNERVKQINDALEKIGLVPTNNETKYDLLWAHDYPFETIDVTTLEPHPRVNFIPGSVSLTDKSELSKIDNEFIPRTFVLPNNRYLFLENARQRAGKLYIQRRGKSMALRSPEKVDLKDDTDVSLQEYIDNPLLVDGYKFDLSVYAIVTSIDPLRIYMYKGDALFRFAPVKYHPFNMNNRDKYLISDSNYLSVWQIPALATYYNVSGLSMKDSFDAYLKKEGKTSQDLWSRVEDAIRITLLEAEQNMLATVSDSKIATGTQFNLNIFLIFY